MKGNYIVLCWIIPVTLGALKQVLIRLDTNFSDVCCLGSNWQQVTIGSDNGLALNSQRAIIWTNAGMAYWCNIYLKIISYIEMKPSSRLIYCSVWFMMGYFSVLYFYEMKTTIVAKVDTTNCTIALIYDNESLS